MAIPVTTRAGKGSPLTNTEMDTNLIQLARSATTNQEGNVQLATNAETSNALVTTKAVTPSGLNSALSNFLDFFFGDHSINYNNGYMTFPGGLIIKWGIHGMDAGPNEQTVTFAPPFPSACWHVFMQNREDAPNEGNVVRVRRYTKDNFVFSNAGGNTYTAYSWFAIGV